MNEMEIIKDITDKSVRQFWKPETYEAFQERTNQEIKLFEDEIQIILDYMEGHDYAIGELDGVLLRGDLDYSLDEICWEPISVDDLIDIVCEWNYELIMDADAKRKNPKDFIDFAHHQVWYDKLKEDEKLLDRMFKKTKYSGSIEKLAADLVSQIQQEALTPKEEERVENIVTEAAEEIGQQVHQYSYGSRGR